MNRVVMRSYGFTYLPSTNILCDLSFSCVFSNALPLPFHIQPPDKTRTIELINFEQLPAGQDDIVV